MSAWTCRQSTGKAVGSLKTLDPNRPIREADIVAVLPAFGGKADIADRAVMFANEPKADISQHLLLQ